MKKLLGILLSLCLLLSCCAALAEEADVTIVGAAPAVRDGILGLDVIFEYNGQYLSWFEVPDKENWWFNTAKKYHVVIIGGCDVDAAEELP